MCCFIIAKFKISVRIQKPEAIVTLKVKSYTSGSPFVPAEVCGDPVNVVKSRIKYMKRHVISCDLKKRKSYISFILILIPDEKTKKIFPW